ncbi:MAG TPA: polysaccharide deacetylase family protein [Gallionellaceae bacterium]
MVEIAAPVGKACLAVLLALGVAQAGVAVPAEAPAAEIPILVYHRFGRSADGSGTLEAARFEAQLAEMERSGYHVIPLQQLVDHLVFHGQPPPPRSVVITIDDGHRSVYAKLLPVVLRHRIPVTLFIYPSAISNASYALTWQQLAELRATGLFDIQSHTYWHPNFAREKRRLAPAAYLRFVDMQLARSKQILEQHLGGTVRLLAWPFGIHDSQLEERAGMAGYVAAFTIERRRARSNDNPMAIPRFMVSDAMPRREFATIFRPQRSPRQQ